YAHSLLPTVKGQEAYAGIPHLQAYKLLRAARLAEMGHLSLATRYCEAIATSTRVFGRPSPFFTPCFVEQHKQLNDRLSDVPQLDGSGSWISKKGPKPSLDSIGNWITGGLTKLIAGDGEEAASPSPDQGPKAESGAFSHYSAISSANTSQTPSPNASVIGLPPTTQPGIPPPRRSGSAMAQQRPGSAAALRNGMHHPTDRSASAMDYLRPPMNKSSPSVPAQAFSANAATTTFYQADIGYRTGVQEPSKMSSVEEDSSPGARASYTPWWGGGADESSGPTPTATTFFQVEGTPTPEGEADGGGEGFVSLMDTFSPMPSPAPASTSSFRSTPHPVEDDEDEEDLGFGNSKKFIGSQPVSFGSRDLARLERENYWVCEKSDGIRVLVLIVSFPSNDQEVYLIDRKNNYRQQEGLFFPHYADRRRALGNTLLDAELVMDYNPQTGQETLNLLAFDCMVGDAQNLMSKSLTSRYGRLREWVGKPYQTMLKEHPTMKACQPFGIQVKEMALSYSVETVLTQTIPALKHGNDGLIFTCAESGY
ncbi:Dcp1p-Dcp2p decapping enzyme complex alpha subunit, partial [Ceratobasidium sp. 392]